MTVEERAFEVFKALATRAELHKAKEMQERLAELAFEYAEAFHSVASQRAREKSGASRRK